MFSIVTSDLCVQRAMEGDCPDKNILHPFAESTFDQALRNPVHSSGNTSG